MGRVYYYDLDPQIIALIVILVTIIFFIISFIIVHAFSKVAEASRLKSEFVGIASHQLRTPLTNIKFSIEYLTSGRIGKLDFHQEEQFKIISQSNERMLKLVSNLLDLSRIEAGQLVVERNPVSLAEITQSVLDEMESTIEEKNISVTTEMASLPPVVGDQPRLRMIIQNLIDNSVKYNHPGGQVKITSKVGKNSVVWQITDTGTGIPKGDRKRVFQKFYRGQQNSKEHSYGTGLGLYIVKAIIEQLGGQISFNSGENEGTTFWFTLPIYKLKVG